MGSRKKKPFKNKKTILITAVSIAVLAAGIVGTAVFLKLGGPEKEFSKMPIEVRQMISMAEEVKAGALKIDDGLAQFKDLGKILAKPGKMQEVLDFLPALRMEMDRYQEDVSAIIDHIEGYGHFFTDQGKPWVFDIARFYSSDYMISQIKSCHQYLNATDSLLRYALDNFHEIKDIKSEAHLKNYDAYYIRYVRAAEKFDKLTLQLKDFQSTLLRENPKIAPYLPGERKVKAFEYWN